MSHILNLPTELLNRIFDFLAEPDSDTIERERSCDNTTELYNLCLVCQRFRALAQPLLCRYFNGDDIDDLKPLISFTKAVYRRPTLGEHVKFVTVTPSPDAQLGENPPKLPNDDIAVFANAVRGLGLPHDEEEYWIRAVEKRDLSVFVVLLTFKTPNIRALRVAHGQVFVEPFLALWKVRPSYLSRLEQIWIACDNIYPGYNIARYEKFLTLPNLKAPTFEDGELVRSRFPSGWAPGTLAAEELAFKDCFLDAASLKKYTKACKRVKALTYQSFSPIPDEDSHIRLGNEKEFNAADAHAALLPHKDTLEHLHVEFFREAWLIDGPQAYAEYCENTPKFPSLADFPVLETIIVPYATLPPHPRFPRSLQLLHITDCNASIRPMLSTIAKDAKKGLYPELTKFLVLAVDISRPIKLPGQIIPQGKTPADCFLELQGWFSETKVDFQICPYDLSSSLPLPRGGLDDTDDGIPGFPGGPGMPGMPGMLQMMMQRAMEDPDFAAMLQDAAGGNDSDDQSWVTEEEDDDDE
ncbi:hypothetical protein BDW74DRAFT_120453 [Aspergillus multicolor]|uniref:uncharacterized protein n=1 Tax=Aspergillus multicolor TaxID=41759 RepID=UPI003CCE023C